MADLKYHKIPYTQISWKCCKKHVSELLIAVRALIPTHLEPLWPTVISNLRFQENFNIQNITNIVQNVSGSFVFAVSSHPPARCVFLTQTQKKRLRFTPMKQKIEKDSFFKSVGVILSGTVFAQAVTLFVAPFKITGKSPY